MKEEKGGPHLAQVKNEESLDKIISNWSNDLRVARDEEKITKNQSQDCDIGTNSIASMDLKRPFLYVIGKTS